MDRCGRGCDGGCLQAIWVQDFPCKAAATPASSPESSRPPPPPPASAWSASPTALPAKRGRPAVVVLDDDPDVPPSLRPQTHKRAVPTRRARILSRHAGALGWVWLDIIEREDRMTIERPSVTASGRRRVVVSLPPDARKNTSWNWAVRRGEGRVGGHLQPKGGHYSARIVLCRYPQFPRLRSPPDPPLLHPAWHPRRFWGPAHALCACDRP